MFITRYFRYFSLLHHYTVVLTSLIITNLIGQSSRVAMR